ncbi:hypothetical protein Tco_1280258 [Tanacetum coccineum]
MLPSKISTSSIKTTTECIIPTATIVFEVLFTESSTTPKLTNSIMDVTPFRATIQITKPSGSSFTTSQPNKGKGIAKESDDSHQKLLTGDELGEILDKQEKKKIAERSKPEMMKVNAKVVSEVGVVILSNRGFIKHQDVHLKVHNEKLKKKDELKKEDV